MKSYEAIATFWLTRFGQKFGNSSSGLGQSQMSEKNSNNNKKKLLPPIKAY